MIVKNKNLCERFQAFILSICEGAIFSSFINLCIILNTVCLALDSYPENKKLQSILDIINIVFFAIFFIEMIIKVIGMGPKLYIKDQFNVFDCIIVMLSIIDVIVSYSIPSDGTDSGKGPISAFRAFRLLRVFKLSKSWKKLQFLISTIARALKDISSFSVLLFLLIFIYVLLGMELFAKRTKIDSSADEPRNNFNNFFTGFILIFTVLTGENWDSTMFQFAKTHGYMAIFFFISLIIIGVMIFLNLFLAILLDNFEVEEEEEEDPNQMSVMFKINQFKTTVVEKISSKVNDCLWVLHQKAFESQARWRLRRS